jgi:hypothetical protein
MIRLLALAATLLLIVSTASQAGSLATNTPPPAKGKVSYMVDYNIQKES